MAAVAAVSKAAEAKAAGAAVKQQKQKQHEQQTLRNKNNDVIGIIKTGATSTLFLLLERLLELFCCYFVCRTLARTLFLGRLSPAVERLSPTHVACCRRLDACRLRSFHRALVVCSERRCPTFVGPAMMRGQTSYK